MQPWEWLEHLSDRDLEFVAPGRAADLRRDPRLLAVALDDPGLFSRLSSEPDALMHVSPMLLFTVVVRQAARELKDARFTMERTGIRGRAAVFDAPQLRRFLEDPEIADYLGELLGSFTRHQSGTRWQRTARGWRRRRYSEFDLGSLESLEADASEEERFHLDRRIGEVALFLLGVFPEAVRRPRLRARTAEDIERVGAERLARAARHPLASRSGQAAVLGAVASHFAVARKSLNFVTDRYLYPMRADWFRPV
jgi:hypothetical protein